jgi:hypothetical protein
MFQGQKSEAQLLQYEGVSYFINGINIPWHKFNLDFGTHYIYGANYDPVYFDSVFTQCQNNGVNCVRIWLHNDGGTTPEFDASGYVTGLDPNFFPNLDDFFQRAQNHNLMVIPSIWDFSMCNNDSAWGKYGGMHANLIQDTTRTRSYINNALIPMVTRYTNQCNLLAWEVMNEPEWVTDVSGNNANITQHVHLNEMQRFIGMLAEAIHQHSSKMVTVGSASIKYNSDKYDVLNLALCVGNLWKDAAVQAAYNKPQAFLDFYCPHYYDWMKTSFQNFSPYDHNTAYWGFDKPVIIEETPCLSSKYTSGGMLYNAVQDSYAGNMFWSFYDGPGSPNGNFNNVKSDLLTYRNTFPSAIDFQGCSVMAVPDDPIMEEHLLIYPNPSSGEFALKFSGKIISIEIVNVAGETVYKSEILINNTHLNLMNQVPGIYFIRMTTAEGVSIKKIVLTKG